MGGYTSGPWVYVGGEFYAQCQLDEQGMTREEPIAAMRDGRPDDYSNPYLIAAAPELLKELTHLASLLHPWIEAGNTVPGIATLNGAWAAIAKARGETP